MILIGSKVLICRFGAGTRTGTVYLVKKGKEICCCVFPSQGEDSLQTLQSFLKF